jgi:predicted small secreted protein
MISNSKSMGRPSVVRLFIVLLTCLMLSGCIGTVVGAVVDTTIEVIKIPFKVGGAVIDAVTPDDLSDEDKSQLSPSAGADVDSDNAAVQMESEPL